MGDMNAAETATLGQVPRNRLFISARGPIELELSLESVVGGTLASPPARQRGGDKFWPPLAPKSNPNLPLVNCNYIYIYI